MLIRTIVKQHELLAQFHRKRLGGIPHYRQAAACRWAVEGKGGDDRGPAPLERCSQMLEVRLALFHRSEEMKHGAIVPDVNWRHLPSSGNIRFNPGNTRGACPEAVARACQGGGRHIENGDARQPAIEKVIDEAGIPASDIDDSGARAETNVVQQSQRGDWMRLIPADLIARLGGVQSFPVAFCIHGGFSRRNYLRREHTLSTSRQDPVAAWLRKPR